MKGSVVEVLESNKEQADAEEFILCYSNLQSVRSTCTYDL
jgi:hypothetical protein